MDETRANNEYSENSANEYPNEYISGEEYRGEMQNLTPQTKSAASWQQKFAVIFLGLFGLSAVVLWVIQFNSGLQVSKPLTGEELAKLRSNNSETEALGAQDTDLDGVSDYNELYLYNTSPYLEDTDSDGISDKAEIDAGEDPNCPAGQNCFSESGRDNQRALGDEGADAEQTKQTNLDFEADRQNSPAVDANKQLMQAILGGEADAKSLRKLLLDSGMSSDFLDKVSDADLLNIYNQTLEE